MTKRIKADRDAGGSQRLQLRQSIARQTKKPVGGFLLKPGITIAGLFAGACGLFLLMARSNDAQNLPARTKNSSSSQSARRIQVAENDNKGETAVSSEKARRSIDYYTKGVRDSMFSAPQPPKVKEIAVPKPKPRPPVKVPPVIVNPFADWTYSGTVSMGDEKMALLENRTSKDGEYIKEGDNFMGAKVSAVTDQMVTLTSAGKPYMLAKADTINVTPLDKSAAYLTAQPQQVQQQPGQPQPGGMPVMQTGGDQGPTFTLPNGRVLSGDRAARYQQRMNSRFNGGGGRGGGFGGGYGGGGGRGGRNRGQGGGAASSGK
jgi:hypothetical protein